MYSKTNPWVIVGLVVVAIIAIVGCFVGSGTIKAGAGSRFPNGISADTTSPIAGQVRGTTLTITGAATFGSTLGVTGLITADGGVLHSNVNSTSTTATTQTLAAADICPSGVPYETLILMPNTGALTLTSMASSTLSSCASGAGEWFDLELFNPTSTAAATITLAAGTGMDLEVASTTITDGAPNLVIGAGNSATLRFLRKGAGANAQDFVMKLIRYVDGD